MCRVLLDLYFSNYRVTCNALYNYAFQYSSILSLGFRQCQEKKGDVNPSPSMNTYLIKRQSFENV